MDQTLGRADSLTTVHAQPILLDESAVPRGQKLPVCQDRFQFVENNWVGPNPLTIQMSLEVTSDQVDPVDFQPVDFDKAHRPPEQKSAFGSLVKWSDAPHVDLTDRTNQQVIPLSQPQGATSGSGDLISANETNPVPEVLSNSHFLRNDSQCEKVSPLWLDLFLDGCNNLSFPDVDLESVLSLETGSF